MWVTNAVSEGIMCALACYQGFILHKEFSILQEYSINKRPSLLFIMLRDSILFPVM